MNIAALVVLANAMVDTGKGLLAIDESVATCNRRFAQAGVAQTVERRRAWRDLLISAPGLNTGISGVILHDETLRQCRDDGTPFPRLLQYAGILVGIKVDLGTTGLAAHPGEMVTEGLDGLRARLQEYANLGARFAKWRGVISIGAEGTDMPDARLPSAACIDANAHALARFATLCQETGLVPVIEPEVLMQGNHTLQRCADVTETVLRRVFRQLAAQGVVLEAIILKPNMVLPGSDCTMQYSLAQTVTATLTCLARAVPAAVPGIAFLSGGQDAVQASARLNTMHGTASPTPGQRPPQPWRLSFSFARALQQPALTAWGGDDGHRDAAQQALLHRVRCNSAALRGEYDAVADAPGH